MFEARISEGKIFKQIIDSIKDLVQDANMDCSNDGISIQSMDSSHVSLVSVHLNSNGLDHYRCDRAQNLGFNSANLSKILKCANNDDIITLKADDAADNLTLLFESPKNARIADFGKYRGCNNPIDVPHVLTRVLSTELKLMDIDNEQLGIPDTPYKCTVEMNSSEFQRIIRDLQVLGETCTISVTKEGIRFSVSGDLGTGNILTRADGDVEKEEDKVRIEMKEPVELNFALRYLNFFTKATALSPRVIISMSPDVPVVVEYPIEEVGYVKYYLAPKIDEDS
jgi:proliferating cell nuclear antigen